MPANEQEKPAGAAPGPENETAPKAGNGTAKKAARVAVEQEIGDAAKAASKEAAPGGAEAKFEAAHAPEGEAAAAPDQPRDGVNENAEAGATEGAEGEAPPPGEEAELEAAKQLAQENYDRFLRLQAEFENYKKRLAKEKAETLKFANTPLLQELLGIEDNLNRATEHARKNGGEGMDAILSGVEMVSKQLSDIFERYQLIRIEALGKPFDPTLHQAMGVVETDEVPENQVMEEFQAGYTLHDRVVRPAMVMVSKRGQGSAESAPPPPDQED